MPGARIEVFWTWSSFTQPMQLPCQSQRPLQKKEFIGIQLIDSKPS
jgi:hypothetical protein